MSFTAQITAVDFTTDKLTVVGHGRTTGDRARVRVSEGGVLPAPLAELTDYWLIVVDADHLKPATSLANAVGNAPINLTTNGSGVQILEVGLPFTRNTDYANGSQVKSVDLDALQDNQKALHALLYGQAQSVWPFSNAIAGTRFFHPSDLLIKMTNWAYTGDISNNPAGLNAGILSSGAGDADFHLSRFMFENQNLKSLLLWLSGDAAVDIVATVYAHDFNAGTVTAVATASAINPPAIGGGMTFLNVTPINVKAGQLSSRLYLRVNANAGNAVLYAILPSFTP